MLLCAAEMVFRRAFWGNCSVAVSITLGVNVLLEWGNLSKWGTYSFGNLPSLQLFDAVKLGWGKISVASDLLLTTFMVGFLTSLFNADTARIASGINILQDRGCLGPEKPNCFGSAETKTSPRALRRGILALFPLRVRNVFARSFLLGVQLCIAFTAPFLAVLMISRVATFPGESWIPVKSCWAAFEAGFAFTLSWLASTCEHNYYAPVATKAAARRTL